MTDAIKVNTKFNADEIRQELREADDIRGNVHEHIMNLRDQGVREALTKLGWTPPGEESVQNQLCARIDELERDKEVLATQVDRLEEQMAVLRNQADALHRVGYVLDLDPGTDLTQEVPARVNRLCVERDEAFAKGKQAFDELSQAKAERAMAIQQAVARARRDWAAQGSPWVKARWQAEALETVASISAAEGKPWDADRLRQHAAVMRRQAEGGA